MKKVMYRSLLLSCFLFSACQADNISKIRVGIKVISKCCNGFSLPVNTSENVQVSYEKTSPKEIQKTNVSLLPDFAWDPKMLVW